MTEACLSLISLLKEAGISYITATHDRNNPRSGKVMKKIGMTYRYSYEEQCSQKYTGYLPHVSAEPGCTGGPGISGILG